MFTFRPFENSAVHKLPDPDTNHMHVGTTRAELVSRIMNYRAQNGFPAIERLDLVIDNYLCTLPENVGKCKPLELRRGLMQYIKGGMVLVQNLFFGSRNMVTQEEADRRSSICCECPENQFPDKDMFIAWSDEIALHSVGERKTKYNEKLGSCSVCTCVLKAICWYKGALVKDVQERAEYPDFCWKVQDESGQKKEKLDSKT